MDGTPQNYWHNILTKLIGAKENGQAMVEFTLAFILLLIVAWIPADFGLAFYTGQLALNASRDGARIAAADTAPVSGSCTMPCSATTNSILQETAKRLSPALMPGATVSVTLQGGVTCDRLVTVNVNGQYQFFFYQVLELLGISVPDATPISRSTSMRWEHQC